MILSLVERTGVESLDRRLLDWGITYILYGVWNAEVVHTSDDIIALYLLYRCFTCIGCWLESNG